MECENTVNHHFKTCSTAVILIGGAVAFAQSPEWDRAWSFREQVGLAPVDFAALNVPAAAHESLISVVRDHFGVDAGSNGVLIDDVADAGREVCSRVSGGHDPSEAWADLEAAQAEVLEVFTPLAEESRDILPADLRIYMDRAIGNLGLDSPYRLLNLSAVQRVAILAMQRERDLVLRDARQRVRPARLEASRQVFEAELQVVLTPRQQAELAQFRANIAANLEAVLDREMANYPAPEDTTERSAKGSDSARPASFVVSKLRGALTRWLEYLKARVEASPAVLRVHQAASPPKADLINLAGGVPKDVIRSASPGGR